MNESTSRLVTTHRARAPSSRPLSPFHRARRASRDRIDDRGTESTTEGLNRRLRARITRNAMISTRNPSTVPRTRSRRSKRSFVHVITAVVAVVAVRRRGLPRASSFISFARRARVHVGRRGGGYTTSHDPSIPLFVSFSSPNDQKKKKVQPPR